jgi:large subunit ribosomal protein L2
VPVRKYRPTSPAVRAKTVADFSDLSRERPLKRLVSGKRRTGGRNNRGWITSWHRGGGARKLYRTIDFRRDKEGIPARVERLEYDPNRTARIALLLYADGERRYILAPEGLAVGGKVIASADADFVVGNCMPLRSMPLGTMVHNVEMKPRKGGQMVRSAGAAAQLLAKEGDYAQIRLPSGEVRKVHLDCRATIGQVGNLEHETISIGNAGRSRHLGRRPIVRGVAMNPVDHPHGGGEGKTSGGRHPVTPWGVSTKGKKTRNNPRTDGQIVRRRKRKRA